MHARIYGPDINSEHQGKPWPYDLVKPNNDLRAGDVVYLAGSYGDLYSWGLITKFERYLAEETSDERLRVEVMRPIVRNNLIPRASIENIPELFAAFKLNENLIELSQDQVLSLRSLLAAPGVPLPPEFSSDKGDSSRRETEDQNAQIKCPYCNANQRSQAQYCDRCGKSLDRFNVTTIPQKSDEPSANGDPLINRLLEGRYKILERIGEGGVGVVYRADDSRLGRNIAIKVLHPQFASDPEMLDRFRREANSAARLSHRNIVQVFDFVEPADDAPPFIAMEFVSGPKLTDILKAEGGLPVARAVKLTIEICSAVAAAHSAHISHRDLKPDNIIVVSSASDTGSESVKLIDFGIAKIHEVAIGHVITEVGTWIGTPQYMSPEQCRAESTTIRSDVYSLGVILYEMLAGTPPFTATNRSEIFAKHLRDAPPLLEPFGVVSSVAAVVMRALAKSPDERQVDAATFASELKGAIRIQNETSLEPTIADAALPYATTSPNPFSHSPSLSDIDVSVFDAACKLAINRGSLKHVSVSLLLQSLMLTQEDMFDSLEMLESDNFILPRKAHGSGRPFPDFEITVKGFAQYASRYIDGYESQVERVKRAIAEKEELAYEKPDVLMEHILDRLQFDGLIRLAKYMGGKIKVTHISTTLKRMYETAEPTAVKEEDNSRPLTELAKRLVGEVRYKTKREAWFKSIEGQKSAAAEVKFLFQQLEKLAREITDLDSEMSVRFEDSADGFCVVYCRGVSLTFSWNPGRFANSLEGSVLYKKTVNGRVLLKGDDPFSRPEEISAIEFVIDMGPAGDIGWKYRNANRDDKGIFSSASLAESSMIQLMNRVAETMK